jgi:mannose-1-phosphate guanylyltransferase
MIVPLIMCGGAGTRLWPASREGRPKQFLPLFGAHSTFQDTIHRVLDPALFDRPIIITNAQYRFLVAEQLAEIGAEADILLEPVRRDSGPATFSSASFSTASHVSGAIARGSQLLLVLSGYTRDVCFSVPLHRHRASHW